MPNETTVIKNSFTEGRVISWWTPCHIQDTQARKSQSKSERDKKYVDDRRFDDDRGYVESMVNS